MVCVESLVKCFSKHHVCVLLLTLGYKVRVKGINGNSRVLFKCLVKDHLLKFWA